MNNMKKRYNIKVFKAPEPADILWENLWIGKYEKHSRRIIIWIIYFLIGYGSFITLG